MKKFLLFAAFFCGIFTLSAACSFSESEDDNGNKILIMENARIKAVIMPESNGRIAELILKDEDDERHFFPELEFSTVEVGNGISLVGKTNYAGLEDWGWEEGLIKKNVPYKAEVLKNTPDEVSVRISAVFSFWANLERTMTITRDSAVLKISTAFTNVQQEPIERTYWQHIMVDFDRNMDINAVKFFIPVKHTGEYGKVLRVAYLQQPGKNCVLERRAVTSHAKAQDYSRLAQPWRAMVHDDLLFGMIVDLNSFADGAAYHFVKDVLSCENIFSKVKYQPQGSKIFHSWIVLSKTPERVDYLDRNLVLGCRREISGNKAVLDISAFRTGAQKEFKLTFKAVGKDGKEQSSTAFDCELPANGDAFSQQVVLDKVDADSRFMVEISANGKKLAVSELLPQIKW